MQSMMLRKLCRSIKVQQVHQPEKALADCNKLIGTLNPSVDTRLRADAYLIRASANSKLKNFARAVADCNYIEKEIITDSPPEIVALRGKACYDMGNYQSAVDDYSKAIKLSSRTAIYYDERANAYEKIGQQDLANADRQIARQIRSEQ